jgi:hypothetical protein
MDLGTFYITNDTEYIILFKLLHNNIYEGAIIKLKESDKFTYSRFDLRLKDIGQLRDINEASESNKLKLLKVVFELRKQDLEY